MSGLAPIGEPPFPPPPPTPGPGGTSGNRTRLIIAVVAVAAVVIAGGVVALWWTNRVDPVAVASSSVTLESAAAAGDDPFLAAVSITEVAEFPDSVAAVVTANQDVMGTDPATGTLTTGGTTAGLYGGRPAGTTGVYGGSGDNAVCDPAALADYLDTEPTKAAAWAAAVGIPVGRIRDNLATLTAVTLLSDTLVTNFGFAGGAAVPRQSVLQAGTAVLVDPDGVPAVRCACGNPLTAPAITDLPGATFLGTRWAAYDPARTVTVTGGRAVDEFTLLNVDTGETFQQPVGPAATGAADAILAAVDGDIHRSPDDGQTWTEVASATDAGQYHSLAASEDQIVAAGSTPYAYPAEQTGAITTSTDGVTWTAPITLQDAIVDVAYGNGTFLALGSVSDQAGSTGEQFAFAVYRSTDGTTWERSVVAVELDYAEYSYVTSIAHGGGGWLLEVSSIVGEGAFRAVLTSTDGLAWTVALPPDADGPSGVSAVWNGERWGMVGSEVTGLKPENLDFILASISGSSADGLSWSTGSFQPAETTLWSLTCAGPRGWLAIEGSFDMSAPIPQPRVFSSPDLSTWRPWGSALPAPGSDLLAVGPSSTPSPATCAASAPAAPAPPPAGTEACAYTGVLLSLGPVWFGAEPAGSVTCAEMTAKWAEYEAWTGPRNGLVQLVDFPDGSQCEFSWLPPSGYSDHLDDGSVGRCRLADGRAFTAWRGAVGQKLTLDGRDLAAGGTTGDSPSTPSTPSTPSEGGSGGGSGERSSGDLGLPTPISDPDCDGLGIVLLASATTPSSYQQDVQALLDRYSDSSYLRTDQSCSSLNQATAEGNPIYAVYVVGGYDRDSVCAKVRETQTDPGNGRWLANTSPSEARIDCGG